MAKWSINLVTDKGIELLDRAIAEDKHVQFTKVVVGGSNYDYDDMMGIEQATEVKDIRQTFTLTKAEHENGRLHFRFIVSNVNMNGDGLSEGYYVSSVGIYGMIEGDSEESLFFIAIADTDTRNYLPEYGGFKATTITNDWYIDIENGESIPITVSLDGYVSMLDFEEFKTYITEYENKNKEFIERLQTAQVETSEKLVELEEGLLLTKSKVNADEEKISELAELTYTTMETVDNLSTRSTQNKESIEYLTDKVLTADNTHNELYDIQNNLYDYIELVSKDLSQTSDTTISLTNQITATNTIANNALALAEEVYKLLTDTTYQLSVTPSQSNTLNYSGDTQNPTWSNYDSSKLAIGGTTSATNAGTYTATFTPTGLYKWSDGTTTAKSVTWTINRASISVPSQSTALTYTGSAQSPSWNNYDSTKMTIGGTTSATNAGTYTATFTPSSNYQWSDGTTTAKSVSWTIKKKALYESLQTNTLTYTGSAQSPVWSNYDSTKLTLGGVTSATNAGTYTATFTPKENYYWWDGTSGTKNATWTIAKASLTAPSQSGTLTYSGSAQSPTWSNYDSTKLTISGTTSSTNAGTYTVTFTPKSNYQWSDGTTTAKSISWTIAKAKLSTPSQSGTLTYTGSAQSPSWSNYDSTKLTISGTISSTSAGTYTATFTPKTNYMWSDSTTTAKSISWTIARASMSTPSQSGTLTYSGSAQSPTWSNYDSTKMTIGGTTSATNAGTYTATFTPKANYRWSDSTTTAKSVTWTIAKESQTVTTSTNRTTLNILNTTGTITVTRLGDGTVSATSSDTSVATVSVSGTTVTVTAKGYGSTKIIITVAEGTNYKSGVTAKTFGINYPVTTLSSNTPSVIQQTAQAGKASSFWKVGDSMPISISAGWLTVAGTYKAFILGFDHNSDLEGTNTIHFQLGLDSGGTQIAFTGQSWANGTSYHWEDAIGDALNTTLYNTFPSTWRTVMKAVDKYYRRNTKNSSNYSTHYSTNQKIFIPGNTEVLGGTVCTSQARYTYYANGNSRIKYAVPISTGTTGTSAIIWHCRDESYYIAQGQSIGKDGAYYSPGDTSNNRFATAGIVPCFVVG